MLSTPLRVNCVPAVLYPILHFTVALTRLQIRELTSTGIQHLDQIKADWIAEMDKCVCRERSLSHCFETDCVCRNLILR